MRKEFHGVNYFINSVNVRCIIQTGNVIRFLSDAADQSELFIASINIDSESRSGA